MPGESYGPPWAAARTALKDRLPEIRRAAKRGGPYNMNGRLSHTL